MSPTSRDAESSRPSARLLLLSNDAMRARRRPAAIAFAWMFQAVVGLTIAWPITRAVGVSFGSRPDGDASLFADGGDALLAWLSAKDDVLASASALAAVGAAVAVVLGTLPLIALLVSLAYTTQDLRAPRAPHVAHFAARCAWPMVLLLVGGGALQATVVACAAGLGAWSSDHFAERLGEARAGQLGIALFLLPLPALALVGVMTDLARAALVRFRSGALSALRSAWRAFRAAKAALVWSWAWRSLASVVLLVVAALVSTKLGGRAGAPLLVLGALHQLVVLARVALRASWLARALRAVDRDGE